MTTVNVRYMVDDADSAITFYTTHLGLSLISKTLPAFADVSGGDLRLLLSGATS
jgi:catechol 2,3-dioxygenase-like lactoylglutathione lyase family enzyme